MEAATAAELTEFRNETDGIVGYVRINPKTGEEIGDFVRPGDTTWLTDEEIKATHRAPREEAGSPFVERTVDITEEVPEDDGKGGTKVRTVTRTETIPPLLTKKRRGQPPVFDVDELAAPGPDGAAAPQGSFAEGEEQGTQT